MASDDLESSVVSDVRRMALAGASDDVLQAYINSRRRGDTDHAEWLLNRAQQQSRPSRPELTPVEKLFVAALKPVVNSVDSSTLHSYIVIIWPIAEEIVRRHDDPTHWASDSFVEAIAQSLVRTALEHLQMNGASGA